jgi:hypothetical protein
MCCPSASEVPSLDELARRHIAYMARLPEIQRIQSDAFSAGLNSEALMKIAGQATAKGYHSMQKIYEG